MLVLIFLVLFGLLCFIGIIVSFIFTFIGFANNTSRKYYWLIGFFLSLLGLIVASTVFMNEVVNKIETHTALTFEQFESLGNEVNAYEDMLDANKQSALQSNPHIQLLQSYQPSNANVNSDFYAYLGFETYLRLPIRYPYSIHCVGAYTNGELFNEQNVIRFDENDNGEIDLHLVGISKLAFDKNYLLLEQFINGKKQYTLFSFDTETLENAATEQQLFKIAKAKGYKGSIDMIVLEKYSLLF